MSNIKALLKQATGSEVAQHRPLAVGFGLVGLEARLADGRKVAVKARSDSRTDGERGAGEMSQLALEAYMLRELGRHSALPVPEVIHGDDDILVMSWIENDGGGIGPDAQRHAAELLAELHATPWPRFGYARDTVIGPLHQPNAQGDQWGDQWVAFFRDQRLLHMARLAHEEGQLPAALLLRLERLAERLNDYLCEPAHPALIHGDLWGGNVLVKDGRIAGLIDPAIYCAHPEIELAFTTMFGTFGTPFFDVYEALLPLEPGFHETRCDIYNLYPLLVHVRLFGASYVGQVAGTLQRIGL